MTFHAISRLRELTKISIQYTDRKSIARATIEDEFGNMLADGEGIFVVPRNWKLAELPANI